jgi:predicted enzyme related to lactoylglutathione lyase
VHRVTHFEVHAEQPERAIEFYSRVFGWKFERFGNYEYWLIRTGDPDEPGIDGGLVRRRGAIDGRSVIAYVCTLDVDDLDATLAAVQAAGGKPVVAKFPVAATGFLAYAKDTEGNIFGMLQADKNA